MKTTRREFIKLAAVPMITVPLILPSRVWINPPSDNITIGFVGMGKQSQWLLAKFLPLTNNTAMKWDPVNFSFTDGTGDPSWLTNNKRDWTKT